MVMPQGRWVWLPVGPFLASSLGSEALALFMCHLLLPTARALLESWGPLSPILQSQRDIHGDRRMERGDPLQSGPSSATYPKRWRKLMSDNAVQPHPGHPRSDPVGAPPH